MQTDQAAEKFDTGLRKIGHEAKSRLALHGLFGTVRSGPGDLDGATVEIRSRGKTVARSFDREQIEGCHLRVGRTVLSGIIDMVDELAVNPGSTAARS